MHLYYIILTNIYYVMATYVLYTIIYYIESQLQNNEAGIEIVPADNGEAVIYHCLGPSTSSGKTVSDSEQPETHHYFELEALPTHQYADIGQLSTGQDKDQTVAKLGKSVPVYEDICSQKFQV